MPERKCDTVSPIPAPMASAGVKIPPGMPAKYDTTVAPSLASPNHGVRWDSPLISADACS